MSPENDILTDEQRALLGDGAADELRRDFDWLADQPLDADLPGDLAGRVSAGVAGELSRQRRARAMRRFVSAGVAAAVVLLAGVTWLAITAGPGEGGPDRTAEHTPTAPPAVVADAAGDLDMLVDSYAQASDEGYFQAQATVAQLERELSTTGAEPWRDWMLAETIE